MSRSHFRNLFGDNQDSGVKMRKRRTPLRRLNIKQVYEPGDVHISDDSDSNDISSFSEYPRSKLGSSALKQSTSKLLPVKEVEIEWSSDEDISKVSFNSAKAKKCPLTLHNARVPERAEKKVAIENSSPFLQSTETSKDSNVEHVTNSDVDGFRRTSHQEPQPHLSTLSTQNIICSSFQQNETITNDENAVSTGSEGAEENFPSLQLGSNHLTSSNADLDLLVTEIKKQGSGKKKTRVKKGGYLEQLNKAVRAAESEWAFWRHESEIGLAKPGCDAVVSNITQSYGRSIITLNLNGHDVNIILFSEKLERQISVDAKVKVLLEEEPYHVEGSNFYLCVNKICKA